MSLAQATQALSDNGQSIWYDNLSKSIIENGLLEKIISSGVVGLTSNPTIFEKAILGSNDYDAIIAEGGKSGKDPQQIAEDIFIADVGAAADLLLPIWEKTGGKDGLASLEVAPDLAHNTHGTVEAAKRIWQRLNRPNVMIKVPATPEGIPAIGAILKEGINVNVTLIFSVKAYAAVLEQYIGAVEALVKAGKDISKLASVASFFVSRVDSAVSKSLEASNKAELVKEFLGKASLANCVLAYAHFEQEIGKDRWKALASKGANVQRPLWASTSVKDPSLHQLYYVQKLASAHTVNTVPAVTIEAMENGINEVSGISSNDLSKAKDLISKLEAEGVSMETILDDLLSAGVSSFAKSYIAVLDAIAKKVDS